MAQFRVFLSAVSSEFGAARDALATDLQSFGDVTVAVQRSFRHDRNAGTLLHKLRNYIEHCDAVICLVGSRADMLHSCNPDHRRCAPKSAATRLMAALAPLSRTPIYRAPARRFPMVRVEGEALPQTTAFLRAEARKAPVKVTYHGRPELVVLSVEDYALLRQNRKLAVTRANMPREKIERIANNHMDAAQAGLDALMDE